MKEFLGLSAVWLLNVLGNWWATVHDFTDWSLFGWALSGATVWMLYEVVEKVQRTGQQRGALILIGLFMGLAFNKPVSEWTHIDRVAITSGLALFGYVLMGPAKDFVISYIRKKAGDKIKTTDKEEKEDDTN